MASLAIGLVYDLLGTHPRTPGDPADVDAEFEPESTLLLLESAVRRAGHRPLRIGNPHALLTRLGKGERPAVDAVWNIAEGFGGRNREAWAPTLLEMAGIPVLGSDALSLSLSLDKHWALRHAEIEGIPVARRALMASSEEAETSVLPGPFPLFVKPRHEGTAKGIAPSSRVADRASLAAEVERVVRDYRQPALVEEFLPGAEYTVSVVGHAPPRALPVLQRALEDTTGIGLHAVERHAPPGRAWRHSTPGGLDAELESELEQLALRAFDTFECRDFARIDFRLDAAGRPRFLEINPLPTFSEDSAFATAAELRGIPPEDLLAEILNHALNRLGLTPRTSDRTRPPADRIPSTPHPDRASPAERGAQRAAGERSAGPRKDWTAQLQNRIRSAEDLARYVDPTEDERAAIEALGDRFHFVITPYYAGLMDRDDPECPIRRQVVPRMAELSDAAGLPDPLDEVAHSPVKNVIRVYRDRIAFCVNNECALYCRFCLRKRMVGEPSWAMKKRELGVALDWIRRTPEIRDVLLTGGDPLIFTDDRLDWLLTELRAIPHVEIVRLGTRLPVTLPQRVTEELCRMLERHHPIWLNTHFNHPRELTPEAALACDRLTRAGIPVGNQSVLLRGVNDDVATMTELCEGLVRMRVRPYYCYQAQLLEGTAHFRVPIEKGLEIFRAMRGRTSGFAIPTYVLDTPYGKVPLARSHLVGREGDDIAVETFDGRTWREPNPRE